MKRIVGGIENAIGVTQETLAGIGKPKALSMPYEKWRYYDDLQLYLHASQ